MVLSNYNKEYTGKPMKKNTLYFNDISKISFETKNISIQVLQELNKQGRSLHLTSNTLNQSNQLLEQSNKIVNLMSWSGWIISFIPFSDYFLNLFNRKSNLERFDLSNSKINYNFNIESYNGNRENNKNLSDSIKYFDVNNIENEELNRLEKDIIELSYIGKEIGYQLDIHNTNLELIHEKIKILSNVTQMMNKKTNRYL